MPILDLSLLRTPAYKHTMELLLQEGYVEENPREQADPTCDRKFLYPYSLYDSTGKLLDCIVYVEYCNQVIDDEYIDGRMTWEVIKVEWTRTGMHLSC